jgi:hypothetical protein
MDARDIILNEIFDPVSLVPILSDVTVGVTLIHKILSSGCVSFEERIRLGGCVKASLECMHNYDEHHGSYKRLFDELLQIPSKSSFGNAISPARSTNGEMKAYAAIFYPELPTPGQSPLKRHSADQQ